MNKSMLVKVIAKKAYLTNKTARQVIDSILAEINANLIKGNKVVLSGFGTFKTSRVARKKGRNPQTGEEIIHPPHRVVRFIPSKKLKQSIKA